MSEDLKKWFKKHVMPENENGCWEWKSNFEKKMKTYPLIQMRASKFSHLLYKGDMPDGMIMLHSCDNPACVNPDHLRYGTHSENMKEMHQRNILVHIPVGNYKLNAYHVKKIKQFIANGISIAKTAAKFRVSEDTIRAIINGKTWKELGDAK